MCEYHCESGWLPVDGVEDTAPKFEGVHDLPMLEPTELTACFSCNDKAFTNLDLNIDRSNELRLIDHWR